MVTRRRSMLLVLAGATIVAAAGLPLGRWLDPTHRLAVARLTRQSPFVMPAFSFPDRDKVWWSNRDLRGRSWVAGFVLATCGRASAAVTEALADAAERSPTLPILTFSLDGGGSINVPAVTARWRALSGEGAPFFRFASAMGLGATEADITDGLTAPTRWLFLIDGDGVVRDTYDAFNARDRGRLAAVAGATRGYLPIHPADPQRPATRQSGEWSVPAFSYLDQEGRRVTNGDLLGHPWIADFIFTRCGGPCPTITARLGTLRRRLPMPEMRFISFSVDPDHDKPTVLKAYAAHFGGDTDQRWRLLSTDWPTIGALASAMHAVAVVPGHTSGPTDAIMHSDRFSLIGASGEALATVDSGDPVALEWLIDEARAASNTVRH